jgi:arylsulfatase A-like enzyme
MTHPLLAPIVSAFFFAAAASGAPADRGPNLLLIVADDLGWGDVGFNGCKEIPTPAIDGIASGGIRFSQGYVMAPQCAPSRSALLTGKDQNRILANSNLTLDTVGLPDGPTLAGLLKAAGYRTGMVGKWHLGDGEGKHPMDRGFDEFFGFLGGSSFYFPPEGKKTIPKLLAGREPAQVSRYLTDEFGDRAVEFLGRVGGQPFFLYLAFNAPHSPMQAPQEEVGRFQDLAAKAGPRPVYAAMVSAMDRNIGKVLGELEKRGLSENTLVVFLSDNGGTPAAKGGADNGPLRGFKGDTLEGGIRVPFALRWPAKIKPGQVVSAPVLSIDLLPTALAAAGQPVPAGLDGVDLLPALLGETAYPERVLHFLFASQPGKPEIWWWAVRDGDWKLAYFDPRGTGAGPDSDDGNRAGQLGLFDLGEDVSEAKDLSAAHPEIRERLQKAHDAWFARLPEPFGNVPPEMVEKALKSKRESKSKAGGAR